MWRTSNSRKLQDKIHNSVVHTDLHRLGNLFKKFQAYSWLFVPRGIKIIGFLRARSNLIAGDPSISVVVNHFSVFVTWSFNLITVVGSVGTSPVK